MKHAVTKIYAGLSEKELAAIAFEHLTSSNRTELERVADSVPRATYNMPTMEYIRWYDRFFDFSCLWGLYHWRSYAKSLAALTAVHFFAEEGTGDHSIFCFCDLVSRNASRLYAVELRQRSSHRI